MTSVRRARYGAGHPWREAQARRPKAPKPAGPHAPRAPRPKPRVGDDSANPAVPMSGEPYVPAQDLADAQSSAAGTPNDTTDSDDEDAS